MATRRDRTAVVAMTVATLSAACGPGPPPEASPAAAGGNTDTSMAAGAGASDMARHPEPVPGSAPALAVAHLAGRPVATPPARSLAEAAAARDSLVALLEPHLGEVVGYKAGLTSPPLQEAFGVSEPVLGVLLERMLVPSGTVVDADTGARPMFEGDVMVRVGSAAINSAETDEGLAGALDAVVPFLELPDLAYDPSVSIDGPLLTAVNVGGRLGVVGDAVPLSPEVDALGVLAGIELELADGSGNVLARGRSEALLGHPITVVRWIRDALRNDGRRLEVGQLLSLGSMTRLFPVEPGLTVTARYRGLGSPAPRVRVTFAEVAEPMPGPRPEITAANAFYYYRDVETAYRFYTTVLGFETAADYGFAKILRVAPRSYLTLVDETRGMHSADEPKSVTLAVITDHVERWYEYLAGQGVPFRAELSADPANAHDGFVAIDPEGYLLEFERFNDHPENRLLLPMLRDVEPTGGDPEAGERPSDLTVLGTVLWLYYDDLERAQRFYERVLSASLVVDQGWAKVYPVAGTAFLGLVDGARGLHRATRERGVTVSFFVPDVDAWFEHMGTVPEFRWRSDSVTGESGRVRVFVGYDVEGTFVEWDTFLDVDGNERLLGHLRSGGS